MMRTNFENASRLPEAVLRLAGRIGCGAAPGLKRIELRQVGQMRQDKASAWMSFRAHQRISIGTCAFEWNARTGPAGLIYVRDAFDAGHGALSVAFLGVVPLARVRSSPELDRGELMRYLAELAWAPDAILQNPELSWRTTGEAQLIVSTGDGPRHAKITLTLDSDGRIAEAFAIDRPRAVGNAFVSGGWRGVFSDYSRCEGRQIPMSAEVGWVIQGNYEPVWRGRVTKWRTV